MSVLRVHFRKWSKRGKTQSVIEASAKDEKAAARVLILFCDVLQNHLGDYAIPHLHPMDINQRGTEEEEPAQECEPTKG